METETHKSTAKPLQELLTEVIQRYQGDVPYHRWFNEGNRWHELVVCILFAYSGESGRYARQASSVLEGLGLLDVTLLANLPWTNDGPDFADVQLVLMREVLKRMGFAEGEISLALRQILSVARDLATGYGGRIQVYLRQHGQRILADLKNDFPNAMVEDARLQQAFILWLQNVLTLPIFSITNSTIRFCEEAGCTLDELEQTVDHLDISASLVDDILDRWAQDQ